MNYTLKKKNRKLFKKRIKSTFNLRHMDQSVVESTLKNYIL